MGNNIAIPYSGHIAGGIHVGTDVVIAGRVPTGCNRFSLNLCVGPTYDQDCGLHFNPRFDENKVVRNHMQGGGWGQEESAGGNPFRRGQAFEIHMKAQPHGYHIIVNHRHFCDFSYRLPRESIQYIYIEGEVMVNYLQFRGTPQHHPSGIPSAPSFPSVPGYPAPSFPGYPPAPVPGYPPAYPPAPVPGYPGGSSFGPVYNPPVPYTGAIQGGSVPGKIIYISGVPHPNASRFTVNLQCGPYDSGDIAMHFDVRFNYGNDRNKVVRTHRQSGNYGTEETFPCGFPFYPSAPFEIMVLIEPASYKVAVNNQHLTEFFHRIQPFNRADHINVVGDVQLTQIRFQ